MREEEDEKKKIQANHEMVDVLQKQMAAIEAHRRMETALVEEEAQLLVSSVKSRYYGGTTLEERKLCSLDGQSLFTDNGLLLCIT